MTASQAPARPPRPSQVDPEILAEAARAVGMKPREILDVIDTAAGRIVYTIGDSAVIIVPDDHPDALGQTGLLHFPTVTHPTAPPRSQLGTYADPAGPVVVTRSEAWTIADLDQEAARKHIPAATGGPGGPSHMPWVGANPIRARALWLRIAHDIGCSVGLAVHRSAVAAQCRQIVTASGWLDEAEVNKL